MVELLYFDDCPGWQQALDNLNTALADQTETAVMVIRIRSDEDAQAEGFTGSPTIRLNGRDLFGYCRRLSRAGG